MRASTLPVLIISLVACVAAASFQPLLAHRVPVPPVSVATFRQGLVKRQVSVPSESSVPSSCASSCDPVNDEISLGCPVTSCCTTTFETLYYNCLDCVGAALNTGNYSSAQNNLNLLYTTCVDSGYILSPMALPGQTASNASSSAPTKSSGTTTGKTTTGDAIPSRSYGVRAEPLIAIAVLLGVAGLW